MKDFFSYRLLLPIVLGGFFYFLWGHPDLFAAIRDISYTSIGILMVLFFLMLLFNVLILRTFLNSFNIGISVSECFGVASLSALGNYLTSFGGGTVGKAVYLKRRYDFSYQTFLASMSATSIIDLLAASLLGSTMLIVTGKMSFPWGQLLLAVFLTLMIISFMVLSLNLRIPDSKFLKTIRDVLDGWKVIRNNRVLLVKVTLLLLSIHLMSSAAFFLGYSAFSIKISIADAVLICALSSLSSIIRITPANIGIQEAVIASSSHLLGVGIEEGLLAAGLLRVVSMGLVFLSSGIYVIGFRNIMKGQVNEAG